MASACQCKALMLWCFLHIFTSRSGSRPDSNNNAPHDRTTTFTCRTHASLEIFCTGHSGHSVGRTARHRCQRPDPGARECAVGIGRTAACRDRITPDHGCGGRVAAREYRQRGRVPQPGAGILAHGGQRAGAGASTCRRLHGAAPEQQPPHQRAVCRSGAGCHLELGPYRAQLHHAVRPTGTGRQTRRSDSGTTAGRATQRKRAGAPPYILGAARRAPGGGTGSSRPAAHSTGGAGPQPCSCRDRGRRRQRRHRDGAPGRYGRTHCQCP